MSTYIQKCFEYADKTWPGWEDRLDADTLVMGNASKCFAGQMSGGDRQAWDDANYETGRYGRAGDRVNMWASSMAIDIWRSEQTRRLSAKRLDRVLDQLEENGKMATAIEGPVIRTNHQQRLDDIAALLHGAIALDEPTSLSLLVGMALDKAEGK